MKDSLVIILCDHPREHTSDYAHKTSGLVAAQNIVIEVLLNDAKSIKELCVSRASFHLWTKSGTHHFQYKPLFVFPFRRFALVERINFLANYFFLRVITAIVAHHYRCKEKYLWIFNSEYTDVLGIMGPEYFSLYDCVDYHAGHKEQQAIRAADLVVVNSHALYDLHKQVRNDIYVVPLGCDVDGLSGTRLIPKIRPPHDKPLIGYVGGLNSRLSFRLLQKVISGNPQWNFVFIGPIQRHESEKIFRTVVKPAIDILIHNRNVLYYPYMPKREAFTLMCQFDVCMIPYDTTRPFNRYSYPTKLFEYFFAGKPVIASPIVELTRYPRYISIGSDAVAWERSIHRFVEKPWPTQNQRNQKRIARHNSWKEKIDAIYHLVDEHKEPSIHVDSTLYNHAA